jgi:salicylate hydroxylase
VLSRIDEVYLWGLFRHPVARHWYGEGTVILGDAAHPTLPFLAQGANLALEDSWVLAQALSDKGVGQGALAQYQAQRRDRACRVIDAASGNAWKYHLSFGPLRWAAQVALRTGGALAPGAMMRQFDWLYGHDVTQG